MASTTIPHIDDLSTFTGPLTLSDDWYTYTLHMDPNHLTIDVKCSAHNRCINKARAITISVPDGIDYALNFQECFEGYHHIRDISALSSIDSSKIISTELMFAGVWYLKDLSPLSSWNVSNIHNMSGMFWRCRNLTDLTPLSSWKVPDDCVLSGFYSRCSDVRPYDYHPPLPWEEPHRRYYRQLVPSWLLEKHMNHRH